MTMIAENEFDLDGATTPSAALMVPTRTLSGRLSGQETAISGESELHATFDLDLAFRHPETATLDEARELFAELLAQQERTQCFILIQALPNEVVAVVLPQLKEIAEYEERMWRLRQQAHIPNIRERWISLPAR